jgi:hypothetical protein
LVGVQLANLCRNYLGSRIDGAFDDGFGVPRLCAQHPELGDILVPFIVLISSSAAKGRKLECFKSSVM